MPKPKIVVCDDDAGILDALHIMLEELGYDVEESIDGQKLLNLKNGDDMPDLVLLDVWMQGVDGREICRRLKSNPATRHVPVVIVSANRETDKIAKEAGADAYLLKPFDLDDLCRTVERFTGVRPPKKP